MLARAFREVFENPRYMFLLGIISLVAFSLAVWLPNVRLLFTVATGDGTSFLETFAFAFRLLGSISTNFTLLSASFTILIAILLGINVSFVVFQIKRQGQVSSGGSVAGVFGTVSGVFGIGCAACGSLILTPLLATVGGAGILAALPFNGAELGIVGVALSAFATYLLAKYITKPLTC